MSVALAALRCHGTDAAGIAGAAAFARSLGERIGTQPRLVGETARPGPRGDFRADLEAARDCFRRAAEHVGGALAAGDVPVLAASDCSICTTTLAAALRHCPDARVLWLDAHGDFNSPETTPSRFLGGMCLAGACGVWDTGLAEPVPAGSLVMAGVRDLDAGERRLLEDSAAVVLSPREGLVEAVLEALGPAPVFVHLDVDVLDPAHMPARYPAPGGLDPHELRELLEAVARGRDVVGVEITAFGSADAEPIAEPVQSLLSRGAHVPG